MSRTSPAQIFLFSLGLITLPILFAPSPAQARELHLLDLGARLDLGLGGRFDNGFGSDMRMYPELGLRLDFLWILALELTYKPLEFRSSVNSVDARWRASALLYMVTTRWIDLYLKAGLGAMNATHLFDINAVDGSIHGGLGLEVQLSQHISIGLEVLVISDGITQLKQKGANILNSSNPQSSDATSGSNSLVPHTFAAQLGLRYFL